MMRYRLIERAGVDRLGSDWFANTRSPAFHSHIAIIAFAWSCRRLRSFDVAGKSEDQKSAACGSST
jgi:hypothetical protein